MRRRLVTAVATLALLSGIQVAASPPAAAVTVRGLNEKVWTNTDQQVRLRARIAIETNSSLTQGRHRLHLTCFGVNPFNGAWEQTTGTFYTDGPAFWYWRGFFGDVQYYSGSVSNSYEADSDKT